MTMTPTILQRLAWLHSDDPAFAAIRAAIAREEAKAAPQTVINPSYLTAKAQDEPAPGCGGPHE